MVCCQATKGFDATLDFFRHQGQLEIRVFRDGASIDHMQRPKLEILTTESKARILFRLHHLTSIDCHFPFSEVVISERPDIIALKLPETYHQKRVSQARWAGSRYARLTTRAVIEL